MNLIDKEMEKKGIDNKSQAVEEMLEFYFENYKPTDVIILQLEDNYEELKTRIEKIEKTINPEDPEAGLLFDLMMKQLMQRLVKIEDALSKLASERSQSAHS